MRSAIHLTLLLGSLTLACSTTGVPSSAGTWRAEGRIVFEVYQAPVCGAAGPSAIGSCSRETYTGALQGHGDTAVQSMSPVEPDGVVSITENEVIHLADGEITAKINAVYHAESPDHEFISMHTIVGGSGRYAGASGYIRLWGHGGADPAADRYLAVIRLAE